MTPDWVTASEEMVKLEPREPESANTIAAGHITVFLSMDRGCQRGAVNFFPADLGTKSFFVTN